MRSEIYPHGRPLAVECVDRAFAVLALAFAGAAFVLLRNEFSRIVGLTVGLKRAAEINDGVFSNSVDDKDEVPPLRPITIGLLVSDATANAAPRPQRLAHGCC